MHQIRFRLRHRPRPRWGSSHSQRDSRPPSWIKGVLLLREGEGRKVKGEGREWKDWKVGGKGTAEVEQLAHGCYATARGQQDSNPRPRGCWSSTLTTRLSQHSSRWKNNRTHWLWNLEMFKYRTVSIEMLTAVSSDSFLARLTNWSW